MDIDWQAIWKDPERLKAMHDQVYAERSDRLERIRAADFDLEALKAYYREAPADFINDWGMTFDPRSPEIGLPAVMPFVMFPRQREFIEWLHERWKAREDGLVEKCRDAGVSWLCVAFAVWMWAFHPGTVVGFGSRKEEYVDDLNDPKSLFWKMRMFISYLPPEFKPRGFDQKKHAPFMSIVNPENESSVVGEAGDNIGRGNRTSVYFKDESAFYERPDAIDAALSQTSNCKIDVSTPNGSGNPFYRKRHSGRIKVFIFDWRDDPRKDEAWYAKQKETLDASVVAQEIDRDYEASVENAFVPAAVVTQAMARGPADVVAKGGLRVGVDVARFGNDNSVITIRRGRVVLKQEVRSKLSVTQCASWVRKTLTSYGEIPEQIAVDTIGIGAGVADILRGWYPDRLDPVTNKVIKIVVDVNSAERMDDGANYNLRSFMWTEMRDWLATASIPNDTELRTDLTALRYKFKGGVLLIESKEDAKARGVKSPDRADSLALTFAKPTFVKPKPKNKPTVKPFIPLDPEIGY